MIQNKIIALHAFHISLYTSGQLWTIPTHSETEFEKSRNRSDLDLKDKPLSQRFSDTANNNVRSLLDTNSWISTEKVAYKFNFFFLTDCLSALKKKT